MKFLLKKKFIFWNLLALVFIKVLFPYSGVQFASIIDGVTFFTKEQVVSQTNTLRNSYGLSLLKASTPLEQAAAAKLEDMIKGQYFAHHSPAGVSPWHWFKKNNYNYIYAGENLAIGFMSAEATVEAWTNSPSHRANLLNPNYKEIGIAVAPAKIQDIEGYLVVQLFGTPAPGAVAIQTVVKTPTPTPVIKTPEPTLTPSATSSSPVSVSITEEPNKTAELPVITNVSDTTLPLGETSKALNQIFTFYTLAAFLILVSYMIFSGAKKELVIGATASLAILILALLTPILEITHVALIV